MKRRSSVLVKAKESYPSKRVTRSMKVDPKSSTIVSERQSYKTKDEEATPPLPLENPSPSLNTGSCSQTPNENISDESEADANILIKMEEVKESLKDGVDVTPGSVVNQDRLCQICYKEYTTDRLFQNHLKYVHDPKYKLARKLVQNSDILPDEDDPNFHCRVCSRNFTCKSSFRGHMTNVHNMKLKPTERTLQQLLLRRFKDIQPDPDDPNCNCCVCQKNFSGKYNYRRHLRQVHKMKLESLSGVQIVNPDAIPDPDDPNYYCNACDKKFSEKSGFTSHIEVVHSIPPARRQRAHKSDELPDEYDPNNYCKVCKKTLNSKRSYRSHLRAIHVMHLTPITDRYKRMKNAGKIPDENDPNNYCLVCEKTFKRNDSYRVHLKTLHQMTLTPRTTKGNPAPYSRFPDPDILPDEDDPNFHCKSCSKNLQTRTQYRKHLRQVHKMSLKPLLPPVIKESGLLPDKNDPNFYCHPCALKHRKKSDFLTHLQKEHSMDIGHETPPQLPDADDPDSYCCVCDKKYADGNQYRKHLRRVHRMKLEPKRLQKQLPISYQTGLLPEVDDPNNFCRVCDKTFDTKNAYRKHLRVTHKMNLVPLAVLRIADREHEEESELKKLSENSKVCGICRKRIIDDELYHHHCERPVASDDNQTRQEGAQIKSAVVLLPDEDDPNFFCELCQKKSPDRHTFHNHLEFTHKMKLKNRSKEPTFEPPPTENLPDVYDPNYYCKICKRNYNTRDNYFSHIRLIHKVQIPKPNRIHPIPHPELTPDMNDPNLFCRACEKTFACKSAFRHHLSSIHRMVLKTKLAFQPNGKQLCGKFVCPRPDLKPDINDPNFFCSPCQRAFCNKTNFYFHVINLHNVNVKDKGERAGNSSLKQAERTTRKRKVAKSDKKARSPLADANVEHPNRILRSTRSVKGTRK